MPDGDFPRPETALEFGLYALAQVDYSDGAGLPVQMIPVEVHRLVEAFSIGSISRHSAAMTRWLSVREVFVPKAAIWSFRLRAAFLASFSVTK